MRTEEHAVHRHRTRTRAVVGGGLAALMAVSGAALATPPAQAAPAVACPWADPTKSPEERANLLLDASTLDQQMRWLSEVTANDPSITVTPTAGGLGQPNGPSVTYAPSVACVKFNGDTDGPWGIAYVGGTTAFSVPVSQAASWSLDLTAQKGKAMADEAWRKQYDALFAPGIDIVRHPWNGRNAEYLGEDPYLAGKISAAWVNSLDDNPGQPVAAVLKHFLGNTQELDRAASSSNIDDRTLRQVYGLPYEITMKESDPAGVMCAFNQLNGVWSCENPELLTQYLRNELNFEGFVLTDNGAQKSTAASLNAGLSQELGLPYWFTPDRLHAALDADEITESQIREAAFRVLREKYDKGLQDHDLPTSGRWEDQRTEEANAIAREMADQGSVLLKNDKQTLPLKLRNKTIAVIGPTASNTPTNGISAKSVCSSLLFGVAGTGLAVDCDPVAPLDSITQRAAQDGNTVTFNDGSDLASAAATAAAADVAIVFGHNQAGEYFDLDSLNLHSNGDALIAAVAKANRKTVVILETSGAVLMPWLDQVPSVLEVWWPGQAGGDSIAALLFGDVNPSGKLPVTFPRRLEDLPTGVPENDQYPGVFADGSTTRPAGSDEIRQVNYSEGLQVGYKWYDEQGIEPMFEFGHGLSYTTFGYDKLKLTTSTSKDGVVRTKVQFTVTNRGKVAGTEIPQVYLTLPNGAHEPGKRLVGFDRITLAAGQSKQVELMIDSTDANHPFSVWETKGRVGWRTYNGKYGVSVGSSSRDLPLSGTIHVTGVSRGKNK
ncbi:beta-glucosidase family protein [Propioniciclava soli]|uniref:beta-glucosidase family protein n=1 Tax=Propioniciclava soli TaxID=2775081 RepID=UPI001E4B1D32|nr:glycoside hydrolase family 3 C-terminal domain-containing protein [Propioniciclava soli]